MTRRKNRETGTHVIVQRADDGYGWETICDEHGTVCVHDTRKLADYMAASPLTWCELCMAEREQAKLVEAWDAGVASIKAAILA